MQNSSLYSQIHAQSQQQQPPQFPEQEQLKCPRCDSANTKFCYYNNYNLSQPRHFCRSCKRYWTKGGALRNIPVGGGTRKNSKRSTSSSADSAASKRPAVSSPSDSDAKPAASEATDKKDTDRDNAAKVFDTTPLRTEQYENLSFSSLLGSGGDQFAGLLDGLGPTGSDLELNSHFSDPDPDPNPNPDLEIGGNNADGDCDEFLNLQGGSGVGGGGVGGGGGDEGDNGCWGGGGGGGDWTGLSIYTPSSNFQ